MAKVKGEEPAVPVELMEVFTIGEDGRLYCVHCTYDTQLLEKARRHTVAVHQTNLKPVQTIVKKRGIVPETLITEIVEKTIPAGFDTPEKNRLLNQPEDLPAKPEGV